MPKPTQPSRIRLKLLIILCINGIFAVIGLGLLLIWIAKVFGWEDDLAPADEVPPSSVEQPVSSE